MRVKVKAFTIIELVITMMISSVLIGIVYYAYLLFDNQFSRSRNKAAEVNQLLLFKKSFQEDMDRADQIKDSATIFLIMKDELGNSLATYCFENTITRLSNEAADTFSLKPTEMKVNYVSDNLLLVNEVQCHIKLSSIIETLFVKQYSAQQILLAESKYHE